MTNLDSFGDPAGIDAGAFKPKPTTLSEGQAQAATSLSTPPDGPGAPVWRPAVPDGAWV